MRRLVPWRALVVWASLLATAVATWSGVARAQSADTGNTKPAAGPIQGAREAWDNGDFDRVPGLFREAITAGGLSKAEVVDAYVRIGAAQAIVHGSHAGLSALRSAALLDPGFTVPPEAGKRVMALADRARREQRRAGSLTIGATVSEAIEAAAPIAVDVTLAPARSTLVAAISLEARDPATSRAWAQSQPASAHLHFDVPARLALPDATIAIVVQARDSHGNELASAEKQVHVTGAPPAPSPPPVLSPARPMGPAASPAAPAPPVALLTGTSKGETRDETRPSEAHKGGFWSSAWPYILGSVALAAGGAAIYYYAVRPTDEVSVGGARVNVVP